MHVARDENEFTSRAKLMNYRSIDSMQTRKLQLLFFPRCSLHLSLSLCFIRSNIYQEGQEARCHVAPKPTATSTIPRIAEIIGQQYRRNCRKWRMFDDGVRTLADAFIEARLRSAPPLRHTVVGCNEFVCSGL